MLDKVEKALSGLARPGSSWVCDFGLFAPQVVAQALGGHCLIAEPEVFLGEAEAAADAKPD